MKKYQNKRNLLFLLLILIIISPLIGEVVETNGYKLELIENTGRFKFYKKNEDGKYIPLFSLSDARTSSFSIYQDNGFYTLGDTFKFKRDFTASSKGGVFDWTSKELFVEQSYNLDSDGFLEIDLSITNISTQPISVGMKFVLDTGFEDEDYFYLKTDTDSIIIETEYEIENPENENYWTSGVRNTDGASLMSIPTTTNPSRIIFGNWDLLDDADFYFRTASSRSYNNPPYSINDNAVLYLYSPKHVLPQNSLNYQIVFRAIGNVENHNELFFEKKYISEEVAPVVTDLVEESSQLPEKEEEIIPQIEDPVLLSEEVIQDIEEEKESVEAVSEQEPASVVEPEIPSVDKTEIPEKEIIIEPEEILSDTKEVQVNPVVPDDRTVINQMSTIQEIQSIIETISKPGIISEENLSALEDLIKRLEALKLNEN